MAGSDPGHSFFAWLESRHFRQPFPPVLKFIAIRFRAPDKLCKHLRNMGDTIRQKGAAAFGTRLRRLSEQLDRQVEALYRAHDLRLFAALVSSGHAVARAWPA